jgi:carbamoyl-phosphate synthase large subunit
MAKLAHEIELRFLEGFDSPSFTTVCARIYRGYGRNSRDVISRWVRDLIAGKQIVVYRPEGMFDYIYAKDSAEGLVRLAEADAVQGIINLGTGKARSVQEVVDILRNNFPDMHAVVEDSNIPFEASQADTSRYIAKVGWKTEYDLERAIPEIIAHEKQRIDKNIKRLFGNVLITSASKKVPLVRAVQEAAHKLSPMIKVIAGDISDSATTRYVADEFWKMPGTNDTELEKLLDGCKERGIRTIIPTRDGELLFWAQRRARFAAQGIDVVVSPVASVQVCLDKLEFSKFGEMHSFPFIPTGTSPDEVGKKPYVVKERYGAGSHKIGLNLSREAALSYAKNLDNPIYQPLVEGTEISVDAWLDRNHQVKGLILRSRDQVVSGESQVTTTFRDAAIEEAVAQVLSALKLSGPVVLQIIKDANGKIHVIECNTRFGGASTTAIAAGLDIFYWTLLESFGVDIQDYAFIPVRSNLRQVRIPTDIYIHDNYF